MISDKEIAIKDAIESLKYKMKYSDIAREALIVLEAAQEEISKLQEANTAMLEVLKRISTIVTEHEEAKYQPTGTVRLIGSIANGIIADIEKGAEAK